MHRGLTAHSKFDRFARVAVLIFMAFAMVSHPAFAEEEEGGGGGGGILGVFSGLAALTGAASAFVVPMIMANSQTNITAMTTQAQVEEFASTVRQSNRNLEASALVESARIAATASMQAVNYAYAGAMSSAAYAVTNLIRAQDRAYRAAQDDRRNYIAQRVEAIKDRAQKRATQMMGAMQQINDMLSGRRAGTTTVNSAIGLTQNASLQGPTTNQTTQPVTTQQPVTGQPLTGAATRLISSVGAVAQRPGLGAIALAQNGLARGSLATSRVRGAIDTIHSDLSSFQTQMAGTRAHAAASQPRVSGQRHSGEEMASRPFRTIGGADEN